MGDTIAEIIAVLASVADKLMDLAKQNNIDIPALEKQIQDTLDEMDKQKASDESEEQAILHSTPKK